MAEKLTKAKQIEALRGAISWLEKPFVDDRTPDYEVRQRVRLMLVDVARLDARIAGHADLQNETGK